MQPGFQLLQGKSLVTLFGWILVVEIFVVSEMRVVVWEAILKREDWPLHGNRLYKTKCDQVASTPPKNGTQV